MAGENYEFVAKRKKGHTAHFLDTLAIIPKNADHISMPNSVRSSTRAALVGKDYSLTFLFVWS